MKKYKDNMSADVNELQKICTNMFHNANSAVNDMHARFTIFCKNFDSQKQEAVSLEDEVANLKETFVEIEQELCGLLEVLNTFSVKCTVVEFSDEKSDIESSNRTDLLHEQSLCKYLSNENSNPFGHCSELHSAESGKGKVICQIKLLHTELQKTLNFINQLTVDSGKAIKELNNCKLHIIPNLEKTIGDLQLKLQEPVK